nr:ABC transporter permease [Fodinicola feengrottensis]
MQVWLGGKWFSVVGILNPVPLAPELDNSALVGWPVAQKLLGFDGHATTIYERSADDAVPAVLAVLGATANPQHPESVNISRPSDALAAQNAANQTFNGLLIGLGAVALLVGGIGVANTMVISALERRREIGLRRALGATRPHIAGQFLVESVLLSALGRGRGFALRDRGDGRLCAAARLGGGCAGLGQPRGRCGDDGDRRAGWSLSGRTRRPPVTDISAVQRVNSSMSGAGPQMLPGSFWNAGGGGVSSGFWRFSRKNQPPTMPAANPNRWPCQLICSLVGSRAVSWYAKHRAITAPMTISIRCRSKMPRTMI